MIDDPKATSAAIRAGARLFCLMPFLNEAQRDNARDVMSGEPFRDVLESRMVRFVEGFCRRSDVFNLAAFSSALHEEFAPKPPAATRAPWPEGVDTFVAVVSEQVRAKHPLAGYCECVFRYHRAMFVIYELNERKRQVADEDRIKRVGERETEACAIELQLKGCDMSKDDARATAQWVTCHISELDNVIDSLRERERIMGRQAA